MSGVRRQIAQQRQLPLADDPLRIITVGADDAAHRAVIVRDRAVGERVVGLLGIAVAMHDEELGLDIGALIAAHGGVQHGADVGPDLPPDLGRRPAERPGMLAADDRLVRIVVKVDEVFAPADPDRLAGGEHDPQRHPQVLRPARGGAERCRAPVEGADQPAQLAAATQEARLGRFGHRRADRVIAHLRVLFLFDTLPQPRPSPFPQLCVSL